MLKCSKKKEDCWLLAGALHIYSYDFSKLLLKDLGEWYRY